MISPEEALQFSAKLMNDFDDKLNEKIKEFGRDVDKAFDIARHQVVYRDIIESITFEGGVVSDFALVNINFYEPLMKADRVIIEYFPQKYFEVPLDEAKRYPNWFSNFGKTITLPINIKKLRDDIREAL